MVFPFIISFLVFLWLLRSFCHKNNPFPFFFILCYFLPIQVWQVFIIFFSGTWEIFFDFNLPTLFYSAAFCFFGFREALFVPLNFIFYMYDLSIIIFFVLSRWRYLVYWISPSVPECIFSSILENLNHK